MDFDDLPTKKPPLRPVPAKPVLDSLSIADLEEYIVDLEAEIVRAREAIGAKKSVASAADALFKR